MKRQMSTVELARRLDLFEDQILDWIDNAGLLAKESEGQLTINRSDFLTWLNGHRHDYASAINQALERRRQTVIEQLDPAKDELLSIKQVADYLESSQSYVRRLLKEWQMIPYVKRGRRYFVKKSDLEAFTVRNRRGNTSL